VNFIVIFRQHMFLYEYSFSQMNMQQDTDLISFSVSRNRLHLPKALPHHY